jgi:uncharacterized protein DUF5916
LTRFPLLLGLACLVPIGFLQAEAPTKRMAAQRVSSGPRIDGLLDDEQWRGVPPDTTFTQFDPDEGAAPTERTSVRLVYDDHALYAGIVCYDSAPDAIVEQLTRRDRTGQADRFSMIIDSYHDHTTAFLFSGTVSGVQTDGILSEDGRVYDTEWDAVWEFDAKITKEGWSAEFKIPFSALRFAPQDSGYVWGINFRRYIARKRETDEWVMLPRKETPVGVISSVSRMGHLYGLEHIHPPLHLELLPYGDIKESFLSQPDPFPLRKEFRGSAGLDLKYGLTNNVTLDMAINPDFGQVEVDEAVLNLTVFETFYPEKRPFFLEGSQIFSFGNTFDSQSMRLFYSRRIGKHPLPSEPPPPGYYFLETPPVTAILGAAKVTGKTDDGLSFGLLTAATNREEGVAEDVLGHRTSPVLFEPRASYDVLRLKKDFSGNSYVGMMATSAFKEENSPVFAGGVDWNVRFGGGGYALDGFLAGSQAISPLAYPNIDRVTGGSGKMGVGKIQDEHWLVLSLYDFTTRNFWINEVGFYSQPREHGGITQITYKDELAPGPFLRYYLNADVQYRWNWDAVKTVSIFETEPIIQLKNFWALDIDLIHDFPAFDDDNRGINGLYHRSSGDRISIKIDSDVRLPLVATLIGQYHHSARGLSSSGATLQLTVRPNSWMEIDPSATIMQSRNEETWVRDASTGAPFLLDNGENLFGDRDIDQYDFSLRGTITFTRSMSVQFFTQVLLAKGGYEHFKRLATPDQLPPFEIPNTVYYLAFQNPDFNEKVVNANVVFRWEYLPGSTLYFVWTQARLGDNGIFNRTLSDNFADAFKLPMDNVVLLKMNYWWSL